MADLPWSFSLQNFKALTREERKQALVALGEKAFRENYAVEVYHENNKTCIGTAVAILTLSAPALTCLYMVAAVHANMIPN